MEIRVDVTAVRTIEEKNFDVLVAAGNLEKLLQHYPLRESGALTQIAKGVGLSNPKYEAAVQKLLQEDVDALAYFRDLFGELSTEIDSV